MWTKYTFYHNDQTKFWAISDTHFCHDKSFILEKRGFKTIEEHDETLIQRWNDKVGVNDTIVHLGDFLVGAGRDGDVKGRQILSRLNGTKILLWGNHNAFVKNLYRQTIKTKYSNFGNELTEVYPVQTDEFGMPVIFLGYYLLAKIKTTTKSIFIFASHYAHRLWIDSHHGEVLHLSGHSHGSDEESNPLCKDHKRLDVGIENFGGPVGFDEIKRIMDSKSVVEISHHKNDTSRSF